PEAHAAMAHRLPHRCGLVGPVQGVSVAEVQPVAAQHAAILPLIGAEGWHDEFLPDNDFVPLARLEWDNCSVGHFSHHVVARNSDNRRVASRNGVALLSFTSFSFRFLAISTKCQSGG